MISFESLSKADVSKWLSFGLIALAAIQIYYVREMVAALILFAVLFCVAGATTLTLFLLDRAGQRTLAWASKKYWV